MNINTIYTLFLNLCFHSEFNRIYILKSPEIEKTNKNEVYNSMALGIFTELCNHHHGPFRNISSAHKETPHPCAVPSHKPRPRRPLERALEAHSRRTKNMLSVLFVPIELPARVCQSKHFIYSPQK